MLTNSTILNQLKIISFLLLAVCQFNVVFATSNYQNAYNKFWALSDKNPEKALPVADSLIGVYTEKFSFQQAEAYFGKGYVLFELSRYQQSVEAYMMALNLFEQLGDTCYQKRTYFNLGASLNMMGDYLGAIDNYLKSIEITNCSDFQNSTAADYYNLALLFSDLGLEDDAQKHYKLALSTDSVGENISFRQLSKMGIAYHNFYYGNPEKSKQVYKSVLKQSVNDTLEYFSIYFYGYSDLASMYAQEQQLDSAQKYYKLGHQMAISDSIPDYLITDNITLAEILKAQKRYQEAIRVLKQADSLALEINFLSNRLNVIDLLSEVYELAGMLPESIEYHKLYRQLSDSMKVLQTKSSFFTFSIEEQTKEIKKLHQTEEEYLKEIITLKNVSIWVSIVAVILIILLIFINIQRNKLSKLNHQLKYLIDEKDRIMTVLSHDLRSPITAIKGIIDLIKIDSLNPIEKSELFLEMENSVKNLNENLNSLLQWAMANKSNAKPIFKSLPIQKTIEKIILLHKSAAAQKNIKINLYVQPENLQCLADENHFELILRNLISNAIKFSNQQSEIIITGRQELNKVHLEIKDYGVGLDLNELDTLRQGKKLKNEGTGGEKGLGLGLQLVNFYTTLNRGNLHINSIKGEGTTFVLTLNLP